MFWLRSAIFNVIIVYWNTLVVRFQCRKSPFQFSVLFHSNSYNINSAYVLFFSNSDFEIEYSYFYSELSWLAVMYGTRCKIWPSRTVPFCIFTAKNRIQIFEISLVAILYPLSYKIPHCQFHVKFCFSSHINDVLVKLWLLEYIAESLFLWKVCQPRKFRTSERRFL